jgi:hypothetical protein
VVPNYSTDQAPSELDVIVTHSFVVLAVRWETIAGDAHLLAVKPSHPVTS